MAKRFEGKVVLITGGSTGMGYATAMQVAKEGGSLAISARSQDKLAAAVKDLEAAGAKALGIVADVSKEEDNKMMVERTIETFGKIDAAFLNAGFFAPANFAALDADVMRAQYETNVFGVALGLKFILPAMKAAVYASTKAAVDCLVKYAAIEAAPDGIRVNSVNPGVVHTPIYGEMPKDDVAAFGTNTQLVNRAGQPEEVASLVAYLLSSESSFCVGSTFVIDGGFSIKA